MNFTSGIAKSNLAKGGVLLAQIKIFFLQKWFLIGSSIRFQTGVTFEEKLYIITEVYQKIIKSHLKEVLKPSSNISNLIVRESTSQM